MSLPEHGGRHFERLTHHGLHGPSSAVDQRAEIQYGDATDHCFTWARIVTWSRCPRCPLYPLLRLATRLHCRSCPRSLGWIGGGAELVTGAPVSLPQGPRKSTCHAGGHWGAGSDNC
ncbi:hypothetical protein SCATT_42440 [Streptantibioticus cattleyicolor NRRL 8057 = DSM 46488]|uniref:Uncharacterized protein n=1 Tax=Streptantibioticus cattleyicolor (strain ATCC 35852 / DSM 46488 / JCM 4925 / NBRC 14057 / NRRL 8057) TaxID=1003195 RepID=G8X381_STREN|nr:hypothetical protein SCATT_42440 [Streptantibioticus cattleyicolor NRRL 8057 = DSM 46488]